MTINNAQALAVFIQHNFAEIQAMVQFAHDHTAKETLDGTGASLTTLSRHILPSYCIARWIAFAPSRRGWGRPPPSATSRGGSLPPSTHADVRTLS